MNADKSCTLVPCFRIREGKAAAFREAAQKYIDAASAEPGCLFYGFG